MPGGPGGGGGGGTGGWPPPAARVTSTTLSATAAVLALTGNAMLAGAVATGAFVAGAIDIITSRGNGSGTAASDTSSTDGTSGG